MSITYRVVAKDPYGRNPQTLRNVLSIQAARASNTVGAASLVLPDEYPPDYWLRDMQFELWRVTPDGHTYLLGDTFWLARRFVWQYSEKSWLINLVDTNTLLERRIVAYTAETTYAEKSEDWGNEGPADNLMKEFVRENLGEDVLDPNRDLSHHLEVEVNRTLGPVTQKEAAFRELLSTLTDLANDSSNLGEPLYFNVYPRQGKYLFRVLKGSMGQDRTAMNSQVRFGPSDRNLTEIEVEWDYRDEKTVVYAGGDGEGAGRLIVEVRDDTRIRRSPFGRIETFYDGRDIDDENLLLSEARAVLAKSRPKIRLTGKVVDTPTTQFGRDYFYGDLVQAVVGNLTFDCLIDAFSVSYSEGAETDLDIRLKGEMPI